MYLKVIGLFAQILTNLYTTIHAKAWGDLCDHVISTKLFNLIVKERYIKAQNLQGELLPYLDFMIIMHQLHAPYIPYKKWVQRES